MQRDKNLTFACRRRRRGWRHWLRRGLALALLFAALPLARAAVPALAEAAAARLAPRWAAERQALEQENAALRSALAAAADHAQENDALRALVGSPARRPAQLCPARALAQSGAGLLLYGNGTAPAAGAAVLDRRGRFAGRAAAVRGPLAWVPVPDGEACFAGEDPAVLRCTAAGWRVTGLPLPAAARKGDLVTTPEGCWLGRLAADPAPEESTGGLTAAAPLCDTAAADTRYFVAAEGEKSYNR